MSESDRISQWTHVHDVTTLILLLTVIVIGCYLFNRYVLL